MSGSTIAQPAEPVDRLLDRAVVGTDRLQVASPSGVGQFVGERFDQPTLGGDRSVGGPPAPRRLDLGEHQPVIGDDSGELGRRAALVAHPTVGLRVQPDAGKAGRRRSTDAPVEVVEARAAEVRPDEIGPTQPRRMALGCAHGCLPRSYLRLTLVP